MKTAMRHRPGRLRWVWLGGLLLVLGGVLGMHGLGSHGTSSHGAFPTTTPHTGAVLPGAGEPLSSENHGTTHSTTVPVAATASVTTVVTGWFGERSASAPEDSEPPVGAVAELCLAVLLVGAAAWLLRTRARPGRGLLLGLRSTTESVTGRGPDRDPPDLTVLCLRRC